MSGVVKGIGKVFKKVVEVVKPILPYVAIAAAIYLTAGAAMAAAPAVGAGTTAAVGAGAVAPAAGAGITAAAAPAVTGSPVVASIVGTAAKQAAIGAAVGGLGSAVTGQDPIRGALMGAAVGGVTGGITGYANAPTVPPGTEAPVTGPTTSAGQNIAGGSGVNNIMGGAGRDSLLSGATAADRAGWPGYLPPGGATPPATTGLGQTISGGQDLGSLPGSGIGTDVLGQTPQIPQSPGIFDEGGFLGKGGWAERNPLATGMVVQGLGQGISEFMKPSAADEQIKIEEERAKRYAKNYGVDVNAGYRGLAGSPAGSPRATDRWNYEFQFNPETGRIERKARQGFV